MGDWRARNGDWAGENEGEIAGEGAGESAANLPGHAVSPDRAMGASAEGAANGEGLRRRLSIRAREGHEMLVRVLRDLALAGVQPRKALIRPVPGSGEELFLVEIEASADAETAIARVRELDGVSAADWSE